LVIALPPNMAGPGRGGPRVKYYWREPASLAFHQLAGVDDRAGRYTHQNCFDDENRTFDAAPRDAFIILLEHQPQAREDSTGRFDLQLSGHVHDDQICPFQLVVRFLYPYLCGTYRLGPRSLPERQPRDRHVGPADACSAPGRKSA
jgi:predicted MPP superfamily phosphohydrolase